MYMRTFARVKWRMYAFYRRMYALHAPPPAPRACEYTYIHKHGVLVKSRLGVGAVLRQQPPLFLRALPSTTTRQITPYLPNKPLANGRITL